MAIRIDKTKLRTLIRITTSGAIFYAGICLYKGDEKFYNHVAMPLSRYLDPEWAHKIGITALKWRFMPKERVEDPTILKTNFLEMNLKNPLGMAAGFDKQGEAIEGLHELGFSFVEIGNTVFYI